MRSKFLTSFRVAVCAALLCVGVVSVSAQKDHTIAEVQGPKGVSPLEGQRVRVTGVVTARTRTGFFIQTPDEKIDGDPNTSEGIFVFTKTAPAPAAAIGSLVAASGTVEEYRPRAEADSLPITEISFHEGADSIQVASRDNAVPKAVALTAAEFKSNMLDALEKYEGMRVAIAEFVATAPTGGRVDHMNETVVSDGVFFGVVKGLPRPFREPGMELTAFLTSPEREKWKRELGRLPLFDMNPEAIRVDTDEQPGSTPLDVTAMSLVRNLSGVLHYSFGKYTILTDPGSAMTVSSTIKPLVLPATTDRQFSVAAANIETFNDDVDDPDIKEDLPTTPAFQKRLGKISRAVRDYLQMPDVLAVIEAENLNVLKRLAEKINVDAEAAGKPNPKYEAFLFNGNDPRGIDCGFLVKTSRVTVVSAKQFGKDEKYKNPVTGSDNILNDRTPIMIEARIADPKTDQPFAFTVVANHLKSYRGIDDPKDGPNVMMKKRLQAEFLARWVNDRQKANPQERILLVGDFNAFQFSDGLVDQIGTIKGTPTAKDAVLLASDDLVNPDLVNLVDMIKPEPQYSYIFDGNAQVLDHFIANGALKSHVAGFGFLRVNADFPAAYRADGARAERFSDHDVAVGYFTFDAKP